MPASVMPRNSRRFMASPSVMALPAAFAYFAFSMAVTT